MQRPLPDLGTWPSLDWDQWKDTAATLHMYTQLIGKTRLALTPIQNHWWNVPFYLTARGLHTSPMPLSGGRWLDIEFNLLDHELVCRTSSRQIRTLRLEPLQVADFFQKITAIFADLDVGVHIDPMPVEIPDPIRFDLDTVHASYDRDSVERFWRALAIADTLFKRFSTNFYGKISPVHFFWGSFDLAVTRFNGRRASHRDDPIQAEAYSHEVISAGFWPGNGGYGRAAFYCYAAPTPAGLEKTILHGPGRFDATLGEFLLEYSDARSAADPVDTVLQFLEETYSAAADLAQWDRANLDRQDEIGQAVGQKDPQGIGPTRNATR